MLARQKQYISHDGKVLGLIEKEKIDSGEIDKLLKEKNRKRIKIIK